MVTIKAGPLAELVGEAFAKAGCSAAEAERIGKYLVSANLTGHDSHGVARVPRYLQWKRDGVVHADRQVKVLKETPVLAVVESEEAADALLLASTRVASTKLARSDFVFRDPDLETALRWGLGRTGGAQT